MTPFLCSAYKRYGEGLEDVQRGTSALGNETNNNPYCSAYAGTLKQTPELQTAQCCLLKPQKVGSPLVQTADATDRANRGSEPHNTALRIVRWVVLA